MNEILEHFRSNGLDPGSLILDGKVHKFGVERGDYKKSGWFCGFQNFTRASGAPFYVVRYGNFRTGDVFQFQTDSNEYTPEDRSSIKKQLAEAKKKAEEERRVEQDKVASECERKWNELPEWKSLPDYLVKKGFSDLFGSRPFCELPFNGGGVSLYLPMRDVEGKIWSLQKIQPNGAKFFAPGGRVQGCFHRIGELNEHQPIRICEGFATGASIHLATKEAVFVAFQSSNLLAVAEALKQKYSDRAFIICGDEDAYTKKPDGTPWNPGREKAEEVARKIMGVAIFPKFQLPVPGDTDWNDLHKKEGLEKVKEQLCEVKSERHYIIPLGYDSGDYFLISNVNPQIQRLSAGQLNSAGLCRLQPLAYWESLYPGKSEGVSWARAADEIMQSCHRKGIFRPDRVRGCGVWMDGGRVIYHRGINLIENGKELELHNNKLNSRYIYELSEEMPPLHPKPLTKEECMDLLDAAVCVRWKRKENFMFYAGWIAVSAMGGALNWRPHLWITGPSGSGKSYVMQNMTYPLLQNFCRYFRGQTTEAGIRQKCGSSTLPVIFDEFETNDEQSGNRIRAILELARQASSDSDGIVAKGTVSGDAIEFRPQFSMIVGSVRINLVHEEDENRFTVLELERAEDSGQNEQFDKLRQFVSRLGDEYGDRLFSRMIDLAVPLQLSIKAFSHVLCEKYPMRVGQQYGTLLAGYWMLTNDTPASIDEARTLCASIDFTVARESVERSDEMECLDYMLQKIVRTLDHGDRTIGEMINAHRMDLSKYGDDLQRNGIKIENETLCIAINHRTLLEFYKGSKWSSNYSKQISRIPGSINNKNKRFSILNKVVKCVTIPLSVTTVT